MAYINMNLYSDALNVDTDVALFLPETRHGAETAHPEKKYPVVYVLHGYGDNHTAWVRKSTIEMVARTLDCIVVMPSCRNSFYADGKNGFDYYHYILDELPLKLKNWFPISDRREDTFIMGNSMGGYGAFMLAMRNPERYAAAVSFSGALDVDSKNTLFNDYDERIRIQAFSAFGSPEELDNSDYCLRNAAIKLDRYQGNKPRLYALCGTEDFLCYEGCEKFMRFIRENTSLQIRYDVSAGDHSFNFWNTYIEKAFEFMGLKK